MPTIHDYAGFLHRRWRFIVSGAMLAAAISGVVSFALPNIYAASVTIDAGTLATQRAVDIDVFRGTFNGGAYRESIADFPPGVITKAWMEFDPPRITIRVDAKDGATAVAGASRVTEYAIAELGKIPVFTREDLLRLRASDADMAVVRRSLERLDKWRKDKTVDANSTLEGLIAERNRLVDELRILQEPDAIALEQLRSRADRLVVLNSAIDRLHDEINELAEGAGRLKRFHEKEFSQAVIPAIRNALNTTPQSVEHFVEVVDRLETVSVETPAELIPMRIVASPRAPSKPTWPNRTLNVLIAGLFGLVGASFAALVIERKE